VTTRRVRTLAAVLALAFAALVALPVPRAAAQAVPDTLELSPAARMALQSAALSDAERAALRLRHGTFDDGDLTTPDARARGALATWTLDAPALADAAAPVALRAEALVRAGRADEALPLLAVPDGSRAFLVRAMALEDLGRAADAAKAALLCKERGERDGATRDERMDAVEATALLARVEGRPARDWQSMLDTLGTLRDADRLDPRPRVLEGRLLVEKDRYQDGVSALREALALDLRNGEALWLLGQVALRTFDFDGARLAAKHLRAINPQHPLAPLLEGESNLQARLPDESAAALDALLARFPKHRLALALRAAADAVRFDNAGVARRLTELDDLMPGSPLGPYEVGRFQSNMRQYEAAAAILAEAARRAPGWSAPVAELGLLEMQSGRDDEAQAALRKAVELDPFDDRARFSLKLVDMLAGWKRFEGDRFVVRCKPGEDEVVARAMPAALDAMSKDVCAWLGHVPARKTVIELHPDHKSFGVRITGMPWIHTIAASTGPLIALEAPREGAPSKHLGRFDWLEVLRHEYVHTVTLEQTRNRIPHWFTEALATYLETKPRTFDAAQLLAAAFDGGTLFDLESINWAFIRPKKKTDRSQAYAQGAWMVEFIERTWGRDAIVKLLAAYRDGTPERDAFRAILGVDRDEFMKRFTPFAEGQLREWGMVVDPPLEQLVSEVRAAKGGGDAGPTELDDATLASLLAKHPSHPDLLELSLRRALKDGAAPDGAVRERLEAYARARPVDPWPHKLLAKDAIDRGDAEAAIRHLEYLDARTDNDPSFATELARLQRKAHNLPGARTHAERAVRISPYDATLREFAAAIAAESGDLAGARVHVEALVVLEPDVERHKARLARIDELIRAKKP
jgi:Flp pilus assembly protein TadD